MISPTQKPVPDNTQHSQEIDFHATGGIRTLNSSKRAATDPRLRPRGHWNRVHVHLIGVFEEVSTTMHGRETSKRCVILGLQRSSISLKPLYVYRYLQRSAKVSGELR